MRRAGYIGGEAVAAGRKTSVRGAYGRGQRALRRSELSVGARKRWRVIGAAVPT
jgi:hypothetical protein